MNTSVRNTTRLLWGALRALLALTLVTGVAYPLLVTGIAQAAFHDKANGSIVKVDGKAVGSALIGQNFTLDGKPDGRPDPRYFQPRPSNSGYDPLATGSGQLGASDPRLVKAIEKAKRQVASFNGVPRSDVPKDAVTGSGSAIDPHISPAYADIQVKRVARANGLSTAQVQRLVDEHTGGRDLGVLGEPHVNVLKLNIAVQEAAAH
ncbi:MAG: potassium-transporting ATPase subunit KdpC [Streptomyces sp.]|jgi:K+-transporting ATPase ATPase C chain|nr:potassium-transporting ATPase subunit KdpC [Streptomyces sp.]